MVGRARDGKAPSLGASLRCGVGRASNPHGQLVWILLLLSLSAHALSQLVFVFFFREQLGRLSKPRGLWSIYLRRVSPLFSHPPFEC